MSAIARSEGADFNWGRVLALMMFCIVAFASLIEPAYAFDAFESKVTSQTQAATDVATKILYVAAGLSLLIGIAPMLWGQIKVKWMVSACCAAILFGLAPTIIDAFAG